MYPLTDFLVITALWEGLSSQLMQYCFLIGSNVQCLLILLWTRVLVTNYDKNGLSDLIKKICEYLTMNDLPNKELDDAVVKFLMGYISLYFLTIVITIILVVLGYFTRHYKQEMKKLQRFMTYFGQFHLAFVFWPTTVLFLTGTLDSPLQRLMIEHINIPYWLMIASGAGLSTISYIFGSFLSIFSYDPFLSSNVLSCHTSSFQFLTFLFKAVAAPILILIEDKEFKSWLLVSSSLTILSIRHYKLLKDFPFYEYRTMKIAISLSSVCLMTSFLNFISLVLKNQSFFNTGNTFIEEFIISYVALRFWDCYFENTIIKYLSKSNKELKTQESVIKKFFSLRHFMESSEKLSVRNKFGDINDLLFWGLIKFHNRDFYNTSETYSNTEIFDTNMFDILSVNQFRGYLLKLKNYTIHRILDYFTKTLKDNNKIKILLISRCLDSQDNIQVCLLYLIAISKAKGTDRIIASKLSMNIQDHIYALFSLKQEKTLDIRTHLNFETFSGKLAQLIHSSCQKQIDFWASYENAVLPIKEFYEKSKIIEQEHMQIKSFWENHIESNKTFASYLVTLYSLYLSLIRHRPALAAKTFKKYIGYKLQKPTESTDKNLLESEEILNDKNTITFHTSMSRERLGTVLHASPHITEVVGWLQQELIGKNINTIIPLFIKEGHDQALENYLKQIENPCTYTKLYKHFSTFLVDRNGYVLPCQVYISLHPDIQKELVYIAIVKVKKPKEDYIIFNNDGYISGFTNLISDKLNLTFEREMHIEEICKDYSQLQKVFSNAQNIGVKKEVSQRKLEKAIISFKLNHSSDSGRLLSISDISTPFPKTNFFSACLVLDLVSLKAQKKGDTSNFQYTTYLNQQIVFNFNFYVLKLVPFVNEKNTNSDYDWKNSESLRKHVEEVINKPHKLQDRNRLLGGNSKTLNTNNLLSMESESDRNRLLQLNSPKRLNLLEKKIETKRIINLNLNKNKKGRKYGLDDSDILKDEEGNNNDFDNFLNILDMDFEDTNSDRSNEKENVKIEDTIHRLPKDNRLNYLRTVVFLLIFASSIFLLIFQLQNHKILNKLEGNVEILSQTTTMLTYIIQINKGVRLMLLADLGLVTPARYDGSIIIFKITDIKMSIVNLVLNYSKGLNKLNNNIKNSLYKIDADLQNNLLQSKIPVYQLDDSNNLTITRKAQLFDFTSEIVAETMTLMNKSVLNLTSLTSSYYFIFNNTINDYLIEGERITPILVEDCKLNLESQSLQIKIIFSLIGLFCLVVFGKLLLIIQNFIKKRNFFIHIFKRLGNDDLIDYTLQVKRFASLLEKSNFGTKGLEQKIFKQFYYLESFAQEQSKVQKKSADLKLINNSLIKITTFTFFYLKSLLVFYFITLIIATQQTNTIFRKLSLLTESNAYLYELILFNSLQYQYIQENATTTIRNRPIAGEYKSILESLSKAHDFFIIDLLNKKNGLGTDEELIEIVKGNICNKIQKEAKLANIQCPTVKGGILKSGVIGLNSLLLSIVKTSISSFDNSPKSHTDMYEILNNPDMVLQEVITARYIDRIYAIMSNIIVAHIKEDFDSFGKTFLLLFILNTIWGFFSTIFIWSKISQILEKEITQWDQIIRQIPLGIVTQNKLFKGYWKGLDNNVQMENP